MGIVVFRVSEEYFSIVGKSVRELALRPEFGITILAILSGERYITMISPEYKIDGNDVLYVFGKHSNIANFSQFMMQKRPEKTTL
ncbi:MAG: TrkA C-terminal domain-containing protein [Salinivirgaceae bacterium]|nr:TrkA C-terminal domain-containing protein [Salinivirgaceae bacterium]